MLVAGDEFGRTQHGNNNAYCQDNEIGWVDWAKLDENRGLVEFVRKLIKLRTDHPVFRRSAFFLGDPVDGGNVKDIVWLTPDGAEMGDADWHKAGGCALGVRFAATAEMDLETYARRLDPHSFLLLVNAGNVAIEFTLPDVPFDAAWHRIIDTGTDSGEERLTAHTKYQLAGHTLVLFKGDV